MLSGTLAATLLGRILGGKGVTRADEGKTKAAEETMKAGQDLSCCLIL